MSECIACSDELTENGLDAFFKHTKTARKCFVNDRIQDLGIAERPNRISVIGFELSCWDSDGPALALALGPDRVGSERAVKSKLAEWHWSRRFLFVQSGDGV